MTEQQKPPKDIEDLPLLERVRMLEDALIMVEQRTVAYRFIFEQLIPKLSTEVINDMRIILLAKGALTGSENQERKIYIDLYNQLTKTEDAEAIPKTIN